MSRLAKVVGLARSPLRTQKSTTAKDVVVARPRHVESKVMSKPSPQTLLMAGAADCGPLLKERFHPDVEVEMDSDCWTGRQSCWGLPRLRLPMSSS